MGAQKADKANAPDLAYNQDDRDAFVQLTTPVMAVALFAVEDGDAAATIGHEACSREQEQTA